MRWRTFLLVTILSALATGGSFTCSYHSDDDDHDTVVRVNSAQKTAATPPAKPASGR